VKIINNPKHDAKTIFVKKRNENDSEQKIKLSLPGLSINKLYK
jgi:hypothetical protein